MRAGWGSFVPSGDPKKAAEAFYQAATIPDPPLHLVLGKDAIVLAKNMVAGLQDDLARFESWSDDLELTSEKGPARAGAHTGTRGAVSTIVSKL